jgi:uncharacterized protein YkwD
LPGVWLDGLEVYFQQLQGWLQVMIRTTIYGIALGTFVLASGANAISVPDQTSTSPNQTSTSKSSLLARQYRFGGPIPYPQGRPYPYPQGRPYPGTTNPGTTNPGTTNPGTTNPGTTNPGTTNPGTTNPGTTNPGTTNPGTTNPGTPSSADTSGIEAAVFQQINQYRASINLPALTRNSAADSQARGHSKNMASGTVPFSHQGAEQRFKATGIAYKSAGENVAYNSNQDSATKAVQDWLKSPGHLANIKGNFNVTGIGVAKSGDGKIYFTQLFLRS